MSEQRRWRVVVNPAGEIVDTRISAASFPDGYRDVDVLPVEDYEALRAAAQAVVDSWRKLGWVGPMWPELATLEALASQSRPEPEPKREVQPDHVQ